VNQASSSDYVIAVSDRAFFLLLLALTLLAGGLRVYGLAATPPTSDDFGVVTSAFEFVKRGHYGPTMWQHPKLRDLLTYLSMTSFNGNLMGVKGVSLTLGTLSVPVLGLLARKLFSLNSVALLAAFFMAIDPVHIDFSRQAIQEVQVPFFSLLGILAALYCGPRRHPVPLLISGVLFGLGLAGKWYVMFPLAVTCAALALSSAREPGTTAREKAGELSLLLGTLVLLPATVYLLTYLPWFLHRGYDLADWLAAQRFMLQENLVHQGFNDYLKENSSYPALWFLKPVCWADFILAGGKPIIWIAISNPFVWMLTLPANIYLLYRGRGKVWSLLFLSALFWCSYLPLALSGRPIWVNTSFAVTPFAFMIVAFALVSWAECKRNGRRLIVGYLLVILLAAGPLYLLAIGQGFESSLLHPIIALFRPSNER